MKKQINIFIVSPKDVKLEREIVKKLCQEIDDALGENVDVSAILWEYSPMNFHSDAQTGINQRIKPCESDMVIVILWERLGSKVDDDYIGDITGKTPITGTQWEVENALSNKDVPTYFYFKTAKRQYDIDELEEAKYQTKILSEFLEDIDFCKGDTKNGYQEFETVKEFSEKIRGLLKDKVEEISAQKIPFYKIISDDKKTDLKRKFFIFATLFFVAVLGFFAYSYWTKPQLVIKDVSLEKRISLKQNLLTQVANSQRYIKYKGMKKSEFDLRAIYWHKELVLPKENIILAKKDIKGYAKFLEKEKVLLEKHIQSLNSLDNVDTALLFAEYLVGEELPDDLKIQGKKRELKQFFKKEQIKTDAIIKNLKNGIFFEKKMLFKMLISNIVSNSVLLANHATVFYADNVIDLHRIKSPLSKKELMSVPVYTGQPAQESYKKDDFKIMKVNEISVVWYMIEDDKMICNINGSDVYQVTLNHKSKHPITGKFNCKEGVLDD